MPKAVVGDGPITRKGFFVSLLYDRLRLWSDSEGRFKADPSLIKSWLFPHNHRTVGDMIEVTPDMVIDGLLALERMRAIRFYRIEPSDYLVVNLKRHPVTCKPSGSTDHPKPPSNYMQERYIPTFTGHTDELPFDGEPDPDEPPDEEEPPFDQPEATNDECCLTDNARKYGLPGAGFKHAIEPYCEVRRRRAWCFGRDYCHDSIMAVIRRVKKQKDVKDYPSYLMSSLQEHLIKDADTIKPPGVDYSTGPGA